MPRGFFKAVNIFQKQLSKSEEEEEVISWLSFIAQDNSDFPFFVFFLLLAFMFYLVWLCVT